MRLDFQGNEAVSSTPRKGKGPDAPRSQKKELSPDEIRAKIMAHKQKTAGPSTKVDLSDKVKQKVEVKESIGDLNPNNPSDPQTLDRVRGALDMNLVNFSDKEREVLEKILNK